MRRFRLLVPVVGAVLTLSLAACAAPESDALNVLPVPELPEGEWEVITPDPDDPFVEDEQQPPDLTQAQALAITRDLAMPEKRFWSLIDLMGGAATEESVAQLAERLSQLEERELIGFHAQLTLQLFALDSWDAAQWYSSHDEYASDDGFLYTRGATVGAGQEVTERAIATSTVEIDETGEGELLLYAGLDGAELKGLGWEIFDVIPLSAETGENEEGWSEYDADADTSA
jgi:hypothetical protein